MKICERTYLREFAADHFYAGNKQRVLITV